MSTEPKPSYRRVWVAAAGLVVVAAAVGARLWVDQRPDEPPSLPGWQAVEPAWAKREAEVAVIAAAARRSPPSVDEAPPHPVSEVASNARPDLSAFRIAEDHRLYDLRSWKEVTPSDGPRSAAVVMTRRLRLTKVAAADRIDFLGRTSGSGLAMRCEKPNPDKAKLFASKARPKVEGKEMTEHRLSIDVSDVKVGSEFELMTRTTFWNSLQTKEEQWLGAIGSDGSKLMSLLILFPPSRPFLGGGLRTGAEDEELAPYAGTQLTSRPADGSWVYWEVPGPKPGHTYRMDWKW